MLYIKWLNVTLISEDHNHQNYNPFEYFCMKNIQHKFN